MSAVHGDYLTAGFVDHVADLNHGGGPEMGDGELTRLVPFLSFVKLIFNADILKKLFNC